MVRCVTVCVWCFLAFNNISVYMCVWVSLVASQLRKHSCASFLLFLKHSFIHFIYLLLHSMYKRFVANVFIARSNQLLCGEIGRIPLRAQFFVRLHFFRFRFFFLVARSFLILCIHSIFHIHFNLDKKIIFAKKTQKLKKN